MPAFRKLAEQELLRGHLITVARGEFESPDGTRFERELVHHPGAVVVVPLAGETSALLVRQYRAAIDGHLLELPAGKRDVADEPPERTAGRELIEEVGRAAGSLQLLARFYNSPGFCDEYTWLYLATDLRVVPDARQGIEEQDMTVETVELDDVPRLVAEGHIVDAKTIIGLTLAREARRSLRDG